MVDESPCRYDLMTVLNKVVYCGDGFNGLHLCKSTSSLVHSKHELNVKATMSDGIGNFWPRQNFLRIWTFFGLSIFCTFGKYVSYLPPKCMNSNAVRLNTVCFYELV